MTPLVLARHARIAEQRNTLTVFGRHEQRRFEGESATLARQVLELLRTPRTREALLAALCASYEDVEARPEIVDQLLAHLRGSGAIHEHVPAPAAPRPLAGARVVVAATGAVATAFTPVLVGHLLGEGAEVRVALTRSARRFVAQRSLEALTHHAVTRSLWSGTPSAPAAHLRLAQWADLVLIAPTSASTLSRLARGDCSDLVAAIAIATRAPVVLAPSMNAAMLEAPSVRRNLEQLRDDGFHLVWPTWGVEVAQRPGERLPMVGPMLPAEELVAIVRALVPARVGAPRPDAAGWDAIYAQTPADQLPWHCEQLEPDLAAALGQGPGRLLDLGCGLGSVAIAAAKLGHQVTASDVSPIALAGAQKAAAGLPIDFVADDLLASRIDGPFAVVVDRALLHTLPPLTHDRYVRQVARLVAIGGRLLLKVHSEAEARPLGTTAFSPQRLTALLAPEFRIDSCLESSIPGALTPAPKAWLVCARRV